MKSVVMSILITRVKEILEKQGLHPISQQNNENQIILPGINFKNCGGYTLIFNAKDFSKDDHATLIAQTSAL